MKTPDEVQCYHHQGKLLNIATWAKGLAPVALILMALNTPFAVNKIYWTIIDPSKYAPPEYWLGFGVLPGTRPVIISESLMAILIWALMYMVLVNIGNILNFLLEIFDNLADQVEARGGMMF